MKRRESNENRIQCGNCGTQFDLNKNTEGCPLCGFGRDVIQKTISHISPPVTYKKDRSQRLYDIPPDIELKSGNVKIDDETKTWGSWLMFNDFFAPKFLIRILANKLQKEKTEYIMLDALMKDAIENIEKYGLSQLKGFPNLKKDYSGDRLVNHFLRTFYKMGLLEVKTDNNENGDIWKEEWRKIFVTLSKEGLEFAQLKNPLFDEEKHEQILNTEEKEWIISHLKKIDGQGYKEYSTLKEVYDFLCQGHNGNNDLWDWFKNQEKYQNHIKQRSEGARNNPDVYNRQLHNYSRSFSSAKISLLRELGVIKNRRNDYSIIGEL
jgi:ribosomal protein L37E